MGFFVFYKAVLRIRDILVRIRIRGSVPTSDKNFTPDPAPDPAVFSVTFKMATKNVLFFLIYFAYYFLKVHLHNFSKIKKVIKKSQISWNQDFSYHFCLVIEGSGSKPLLLMDPIQIWI
jgi:hypothetical protein